MDNKNIIIVSVVVLALVVIGGAGLYFYNQQVSTQGTQQNQQVKGKVILGITDAAASMESVSSVLVNVDQVQIYSQAEGWVTVSNSAKQFDLIALKNSGKIVVLAEGDVMVGNYDQMRLHINKVVVVENGVQKEAKLPSNELKIMGNVVVESDTRATAVFDFIADESLHKTGSGMFIFTPVIKVETRSDADAQVTSGGEVEVKGGKVQTNQSVGMDVNGEIKTNFKVDSSVKLDIIGNAIKVITNDENTASVKVSASTAIDTVTSNGSLDTVISIKLIVQNGKKVWSITGLKNLSLRNVYVDAQTGVVSY